MKLKKVAKGQKSARRVEDPVSGELPLKEGTGYLTVVFTSYEIDLLPKEQFKDRYEYLVYQQELCPTTQKMHYQGYVVFKSKIKFSTMKNLWPKTCFFHRRGSHIQAKTYCQKEESRVAGPWEYGSDSMVPHDMGSRTDLNEVRDAFLNGATQREVANKWFPQWVRYDKAFSEYANMLKEEKTAQWFNEQLCLETMWPWQVEAMALVLKYGQSDRVCLWIWESVGKTGKTRLGLRIKYVYSGFFCQNGKSEHVACAYNGEPIVALNYTRKYEGFINYSIIESFKDGQLFSPKYNSNVKAFKPPSVVVFANFPPEVNSLSVDRWDVRQLTKSGKSPDSINLGKNTIKELL